MPDPIRGPWSSCAVGTFTPLSRSEALPLEPPDSRGIMMVVSQTPPTLDYAAPSRRRPGVWALLAVLAACGVGFTAMWWVAESRMVVPPPLVAALRPPGPLVPMPTGPVEMTIVQRQSQAIPGSGGQVLVAIGDITGGHVTVTIRSADDQVPLPATSMAVDESAAFRVGDADYHLALTALRNVLIGDDQATITVRPAAPATAPAQFTEPEKIERLIQYVAGRKDAVFIRNGAEHTCAEAAEHMRGKLRSAGASIKTARDFIEQAASRSSLSGQPYRVRLADREIAARDLLLEELGRIEALAPER